MILTLGKGNYVIFGGKENETGNVFLALNKKKTKDTKMIGEPVKNKVGSTTSMSKNDFCIEFTDIEAIELVQEYLSLIKAIKKGE